MGSGASHESATAALAAGVSEADIAAHLASLDKKPVTVFYNPGSSNSLSCAIMGSSIGCAELKVIQLTGEQKGPEFVAVNPYGQVPGMSDESNGLNLGESTAILRYLAQQYKPSLYPGTIAERARIDMAIAQFKEFVYEPWHLGKDSSDGYVGVSYCVLGDLFGIPMWPLGVESARRYRRDVEHTGGPTPKTSRRPMRASSMRSTSGRASTSRARLFAETR